MGSCLSGGVVGRWATEGHTAAVCLMLWKLILVGDVGMDMARATGTRREWWSCHRCHRFLRAERTCRDGERFSHLLSQSSAIPIPISRADNRVWDSPLPATLTPRS